MDVNAAAASLTAAKVPTKELSYIVTSIIASVSAIIASKSPNHKGSVEVEETPSPNMKAISPKHAETLNPCVTSVMTIDTNTIEEQTQELREMFQQVLKDSQEKNKKTLERS